MEAIALTRAAELIQATETLEQLGGSPERVLRQANLPMWHYCDPDDLIPDHHIRVFLDSAGRMLGTPNFGLLVGAQTSLFSMGSFGRLISNALTTYHALDTTCRLIQLQTNAGHYSMAELGDEVWFYGSRYHGPETGRREREQYAMVRMLDHVRMGAGASWLPAKVCLQTREAPDRELRAAFGDPAIRVGQKLNGFAVPRALLAQPLWHDGKAAEGERSDEVARLRHSAPAPSFVDTMRQLVGTMLKQGEGPPRIETMAEIAGLSVRSLQRRLSEYGLTHFELVDQARYQAATRLLEDADNRITDIGIELGYADAAHFSRAFKRWAGVTPREYRNSRPLH